MIAFNNDYFFQPQTVAKSTDGDTMELYGMATESTHGTINDEVAKAIGAASHGYADMPLPPGPDMAATLFACGHASQLGARCPTCGKDFCDRCFRNHRHAPRTVSAVTHRRQKRLTGICAIDERGRVKTWGPLIACVILAAMALAVCWIVGVK